jgi:hypothetical protein
MLCILLLDGKFGKVVIVVLQQVVALTGAFSREYR